VEGVRQSSLVGRAAGLPGQTPVVGRMERREAVVVDERRSSDETRGTEGSAESNQSRWCVVGNVVAERLHGSEGEVRHGTKHFSPGTKVYLVDAYWGRGGETVTVLGLARRPKRWISVDVSARVLENWRAKVIYDPGVLRRLLHIQSPTEAEASRISSVLGRISSTERVRLVEREPREAEAAAEELESRGLTILRASVPVLSAPQASSAWVLYDGADPVASAGLGEPRHGVRSWRDLWILSDRPETLAELIVLVERRADHTNFWSLTELVTQIRQAREGAYG
jgi:hypothetical protein